jgi:hypothetical protein
VSARSVRARADRLCADDMGLVIRQPTGFEGVLVGLRSELSGLDEALGREEDEPLAVWVTVTGVRGANEWFLAGNDVVVLRPVGVQLRADAHTSANAHPETEADHG